MARISALSITFILSVLATRACVLTASAADAPRRYSDPAQPPFGVVTTLPAAVYQISKIADQNGDGVFLVVDKVHGKIALFENGEVKFAAAALTGQSTADVLPPDATAKTYAQHVGVKYKVTPAGRYTVSPGFDPTYGAVLDINEIQGPDWMLSIHLVALWNRSQQRDARLRSANDEDKHITDGCIDVETVTIRRLVKLLANKSDVPIYILPMDETLTPDLFPGRATVRR
jgi:hypothetical protein